jgi:hypothetical protein
MYRELKTEASAIEDILSKIADLSFLRTEDDYSGAFVMIRGEYHEDTTYLQEDSPDIRLEWKCIRAIANYLKTAFFSDIVYTSLEDYEKDVRQQEITLWVGESFAYGILKQLVKVRSNHERSQLQNRTIGMLFLMSRIYQASNEAKPKPALMSYTWGEKLCIDYPEKQTHSFTKALELMKAIIEELESIPEFLAE